MFSKTVSDKVEIAKYLKYLAPIDYGMPFEILKNGFDTTNIIIGLVIITASVILAFIIYNKKDLNI
jgi:ABC-2 type transport system permease protein